MVDFANKYYADADASRSRHRTSRLASVLPSRLVSSASRGASCPTPHRSESWTRTVVNAIKSGRGARAPVTAKYRRRRTCRYTPSSET